ncbi:protein kinase domain-containing protein [Ditylenchus destructor]|uniref:non-specific serine/threonine protein kinase n=1 Tax=Ditylenchus destructor TaxID=166010 RepID=A0AAD4R7G0_9BILA|nr:protein kinase domain-containing protein [Ditylenchus destructor]
MNKPDLFRCFQKYINIAIQVSVSSRKSASSHMSSALVSNDPGKDFVIAGQYQLRTKLGSGSFGDVYSAISLKTSSEYAIKLEHIKARHPQLQYEYKVYKMLQGGSRIPCVHTFGQERNFNFLIVDILGKSVEEYFIMCERKFSLKTVLHLAQQMLSAIEFVHSRGLIHRDIKPDNFVMGLRLMHNKLYMIDFGLAKKYRDSRSLEHIPYREGKSLTGTARYASINAHIGAEQSRRDDLESLGYVLVYLCAGVLPWQGLPAKDKKEKYTRISQKKQATTIEKLCQGLPAEFVAYLKYSRSLRFEETPDYKYLDTLFQNLRRTVSTTNELVYDWSKPRNLPTR